MYWGLYQILVLLGAGASAGAWLVRPHRPVLSISGAALWTIVALQAKVLTAYSGGTSFAVETGRGWQYVATGFAVLSLATAVLWYLGVYPPAEEPGQAKIPEKRAQQETQYDQQF